MKAVVQNYYGTAAEWDRANPRLYKGVWGIAEDGGTRRLKIGDGIHSWQQLPYMDVGFVMPGEAALADRVRVLEEELTVLIAVLSNKGGE